MFQKNGGDVLASLFPFRFLKIFSVLEFSFFDYLAYRFKDFRDVLFKALFILYYHLYLRWFLTLGVLLPFRFLALLSHQGPISQSIYFSSVFLFDMGKESRIAKIKLATGAAIGPRTLIFCIFNFVFIWNLFVHG